VIGYNGGSAPLLAAHSMLRIGHTKSCGCLIRERIGAVRKTHGLSGTKEHRAWKAMLTRCLNPKSIGFENYGGRGISVCEEWARSFSAFLTHVGAAPSAEHTIDRIENDSGYKPGNVRWATRSEQMRNRRKYVYKRNRLHGLPPNPPSEQP
jgi:hypothetical protein